MHGLINWISGEWMVKHRNGGDVVFKRAVWLAALGFAAALTVENLLSLEDLTMAAFRKQLIERATWLAALFAAAYAALYTRFASQWTYLAGLFNQIVQTECGDGHDQQRIAEWKVAFAIDARELHLSEKFLFAHVLSRWLREEIVANAYRTINERADDYEAFLKPIEAVVRERRAKDQAGRASASPTGAR